MLLSGQLNPEYLFDSQDLGQWSQPSKFSADRVESLWRSKLQLSPRIFLTLEVVLCFELSKGD